MYLILLIGSAALFAGVVIAYLRHPVASLLHPASWYLIFHGFIFVIRPLFAHWYGFDFVYRLYDFQPSLSDKITVIAGANLAMLVFVGVALWIARNPTIAPDARDQARTRSALFWPIVLSAALVSPLGVAAQFSNWTRRINDFDSMVRDAATGSLINVDGNGWFTDSALLLAPMSVLLVWLARYRWWGWGYFAGFALLQSGTGGRGPLIYAVAAIAVLYIYEHGRKWFDWRPLVLVVLAGLAFNQLVVDRGSFIREAVGQSGDGYVSRTDDLDPLEHMDFANLEYFEYIVYAVPQRTGSWDYFANNLQIFTEPVPRALWKGKPVGSPVKFFLLADYGRPTGMTASLPGMGWMSLGYLGVAIQSAFFACLFALLYNALLIRRRSAIAGLGFALTIATSVLVFRDGTLLTLLRLLPFYLSPFLLALFIARMAGLGQAQVPVSVSNAVAGFLAKPPAGRRKDLAMQAESSARQRKRVIHPHN